MTLTFDDDILLAALGEALTPEAVEPGAHELATLHRALDAWPVDTDGNDDVRLASVIPMFTPSNRSVTWARIHRLRHPVAAAVAVGILATSGVAAAGVATDRLPGPARNVAYALGLPVTSPALESARGTMVQLGAALADHDAVQVRTSATLLHTQMAGLSATDLTQIQTLATDLLVQAYVFLVAAAASQGAAAGAAGTSGASRSLAIDGLGVVGRARLVHQPDLGRHHLAAESGDCRFRSAVRRASDRHHARHFPTDQWRVRRNHIGHRIAGHDGGAPVDDAGTHPHDHHDHQTR